MSVERQIFTKGLIPGRAEQPPNFYDHEYYSGAKAVLGVQFPKDGSYLNPESDYRFKSQDLFYWIEGFLPKGVILDVGCGPSHLAYWSEKLRKPFIIIGCDFSETLLRSCYNQNPKKTTVSFAHELPFADKQFDGVLFSDILEHLFPEHALVAVKEAYRVLKEKGWIFINIPNRITWSDAAYKDQGHVWLPSIKEIKYLLEMKGFKEKGVPAFTRGFPLSKPIRRITSRDLRFPWFGRSIFASAQK